MIDNATAAAAYDVTAAAVSTAIIIPNVLTAATTSTSNAGAGLHSRAEGPLSRALARSAVWKMSRYLFPLGA